MAPSATLSSVALLLLASVSSAQTAPVAADDAYTTSQGANLSVDAPGVLSNDSDADGDPLTAVLVPTPGTVGLLMLNADGSLEYEPSGFVGVETFHYMANDGGLNSNPAEITFSVTPGTGATGYTDETLFLDALTAQGFTPQLESFEDDAVWGAVRTPNTAPSVTSQGITWESPIGTSQVTTGSGPALDGNYGFFALPHGDYLAGPQCSQPGVCTDRWKGTSSQPLVAMGGWMKPAGLGKIALFLDGDEAHPVDLGSGSLSSWRFFGVIAPQGFTSFEYREMEGTNTDAVFIFGDKFSFARMAPDPWADLGHALAGTHGLPGLSGGGTLVAGDPLTVTLGNALENTTAWLVLGLSQLNAPFKGGVLVPALDVSLPLPSGPAGTIVIDSVWPAGLPAGFTTYLQYWIVDPVGPVGMSASNGLSATAP